MRPTISLLCLVLLAAGTHGSEPARQHPLIPVLTIAKQRCRHIDSEIKDYSCILVKRERIDGMLMDPEFIFVKLRHEQIQDGRLVVPFGVYLRFLAPSDVEGREVVYVQGQNNGKLIARRGGRRFAYFSTALDPRSELAMQGNRYPLTEIGIKNLMIRLVEVGEEDLQYDECEVKYYTGAKINQRVCTAIEVTHPIRRDYFRYHVAQIFIDDELQLPIRYASYDWPEEEGGRPRLLEEYTYLDLKLNVGFSDLDFDYRNKNYGFRKDLTTNDTGDLLTRAASDPESTAIP